MKRLIYILICVMTAWSCSEVSESERFEYVKPAEVKRNVLLEDYTGQKCVNCPNAVDEIHKLQELYGEDHVIAVAIHGGPMAVKSNSKVLGLRTDLADTYYTTANIEANPMGVINRSGTPITPDQWQSAVSAAIQKTAPVDIETSGYIDNNTINIESVVTGVDGKTTGKLQLWILEDGITAMQLMPDGSANADFVHNHVLRAAVNRVWGEDISINEGAVKQFNYKFTPEEDWNQQNLSLVTFIYNDSGVVQVVKSKIETPDLQ